MAAVMMEAEAMEETWKRMEKALSRGVHKAYGFLGMLIEVMRVKVKVDSKKAWSREVHVAYSCWRVLIELLRVLVKVEIMGATRKKMQKAWSRGVHATYRCWRVWIEVLRLLVVPRCLLFFIWWERHEKFFPYC